MQTYTQQLYENLELQLKEIKVLEFNLLRQNARCIEVCQESIKELKWSLSQHPFKDKEEEILFFKEIQPKFYCQFIYHVRVFTIETNRPAGSDKVQRKYLKDQLHRIKQFFDTNLDFYQYYRTGATHFDEAYFVRGQQNMRLLPDDLQLAMDPEFCTVQSYKVATLSANELLRIYINSAIAEIDRAPHLGQNGTTPKNALKWTGSKVALIELIYALQSTQVLNNASADIKLISGFFENIFDIDLGNVYHVFQEMRLRKKNRTSFIDLLRDRLTQRMDIADESF